MTNNAVASVIVAAAQSVAKVFVIGGIGYAAVRCKCAPPGPKIQLAGSCTSLFCNEHYSSRPSAIAKIIFPLPNMLSLFFVAFLSPLRLYVSIFIQTPRKHLCFRTKPSVPWRVFRFMH